MAKWSGKLRDFREFYADCFDDFLETVKQLCKDHTIPQIFGASIVVVLYAVCMMLLWALLSIVIALPVWLLWEPALLPLGLRPISYPQAYCLTLICAILFRGNSVHLKE